MGGESESQQQQINNIMASPRSQLLLPLTIFLVLISPVISTTSSAPDFIATTCKTAPDPSLCSMSLNPFSETIENDPAEAVKIMMSMTQRKAQTMATHIDYLSHNVSNSNPQLTSALSSCLVYYNGTAEGMKSTGVTISNLASFEDAQAVVRILDSLDMVVQGFVDDAETCKTLWKDIPENDPIKADFLRRGKTLKVDEFTSTTYHVLSDFINFNKHLPL